MPSINLSVEGFLKIYDPNSHEVLVDKKNAIHFENISEALANSISNKGVGRIYGIGFGNGGASVDQTGIITYLTPNTVGQNADLYNQTYFKIVDDSLVENTDRIRNKITVLHSTGKVYTDILISCLLDYGEPSGQQAFDNSTNLDGEFVFDELGVKTWYGEDNLKLITHVIFHPVQKSLNRQIQIDYTIRIQSLTYLSSCS
jgi:hypothetical protein